MKQIIYCILIFIASIITIILGGQAYEYGFAWLGLIIEGCGVTAICYDVFYIGYLVIKYLDNNEKNLFNS